MEGKLRLEQKASKGHEKQQKATESHKNKSESRRRLATKTTIGHSRKQKATTENS
jgi:hypothetical protein